jgi:hypothetical protein
MSAPKPVHRLTKVDRKNKTAVCSVCGPTEITVAKRRAHHIEKVSCINRARASYEARNRRVRLEKRLQNPAKKPRHSLSQINVEKMRAICAVCGPTAIKKRRVGQQYPVYICATKKLEYGRRYRLTRTPIDLWKSEPSTDAQSEIDDESKNTPDSSSSLL